MASSTAPSAPVLAQPVLTPPVHRNLTVLDRALFTLDIPLLAAVVPAAQTSFFSNQLKNYLLRVPKFGHVEPEPTSNELRRVLLRTSDRSQLPAELFELLAQQGVTTQTHILQVDYDHFTADQILQSILPEDLLDESPTAFTQVGHIAHMNLRDEYLPYRHIIGQVVLDKNKALRTVVNKLDTIDNVFRNFKMEVIAGDDDFIVHTSEGGCTFTFDFSKVYWNSRLSTEHARLVASFSPHDVIVDAFAGVGPFAIPAGKKGCGVLASDLNPASASALAANAKSNSVEATVRTANDDARDFIRQSVLDIWSAPFPPFTPHLSSKARSKRAKVTSPPLEQSSSTAPVPTPPPGPAAQSRRLVDHFVMNLPASAIEFLDAFRGLYRELYKLEGAREAIDQSGKLPMVHCYCFTKDVEHAEHDILARATNALGWPVTKETEDYNLRFVRDVAPKKEMYCLEFRLSKSMVA